MAKKKPASKLRESPLRVESDTEPTHQTPAKSGSADGKPGFAVVGLGASAGGLDAFKQFFTAMPADSGMAFVLIQHFDPTHISLTDELRLNGILGGW